MPPCLPMDALLASLAGAGRPFRDLDIRIVLALEPEAVCVERGPLDGVGLDHLFVFSPPRRWVAGAPNRHALPRPPWSCARRT